MLISHSVKKKKKTTSGGTAPLPLWPFATTNSPQGWCDMSSTKELTSPDHYFMRHAGANIWRVHTIQILETHTIQRFCNQHLGARRHMYTPQRSCACVSTGKSNEWSTIAPLWGLFFKQHPKEAKSNLAVWIFEGMVVLSLMFSSCAVLVMWQQAFSCRGVNDPPTLIRVYMCNTLWNDECYSPQCFHLL